MHCCFSRVHRRARDPAPRVCHLRESNPRPPASDQLDGYGQFYHCAIVDTLSLYGFRSSAVASSSKNIIKQKPTVSLTALCIMYGTQALDLVPLGKAANDVAMLLNQTSHQIVPLRGKKTCQGSTRQWQCTRSTRKALRVFEPDHRVYGPMLCLCC
jgi:hypothetical protein